MVFILSNGDAENAVPAAIKFFVYSIVGSLPVLIGVLVIYFYNGGFTGDYTFDILKLSQVQLPVKYQTWLFAAFAFSFALRIPLLPFHTWFIDSCVSTSTGGCIMLAAVAMKMGLYGFLRFCLPFFPYAVEQFTPVLFAIGIATLIYMAAIAIIQNDMKKVAVYGAISQLSFVIIGIFTLNNQSVQGSLLHMLNHGLSIAALFFVTGMIYDRKKTNLMTDFGGLAKRAPVLTTLFVIIVLSLIGLPGLNGFVGEFLILLGVFFNHKIVAILVLAGAVLTIVYMLKLFQTVMLGKLQNVRNIKFDDLSKREIAVLTPIIVLMVLIGAYPNLFLEKVAPAVDHLIKTAALWQNH